MQKNQKKTIEVFSELKKIQNKSKLLIIGNGSLKKELESLISLKGIGDSVTILPTKEDVSGYYSAMDLFLFPSKYEGLGIVAIEAQTNGLPVLASNCLPKELELTPLFTTEYLRESSEKWALRILENYSVSNGKDRNNLDNIQKIKRAGYEIKITADLLVKFYCDILTQYNAQ